MKLKAVLFDLDGTLLPMDQNQGQVHVGCDEKSTTITVVLPCFIDG